MYSFNEVSSFDPDLAKAMDDELAKTEKPHRADCIRKSRK